MTGRPSAFQTAKREKQPRHSIKGTTSYSHCVYMVYIRVYIHVNTRIFIGGTDTEAEAPIFWPPDVKSWLAEKDPKAGKDWEQEKGATEDEMVGWHPWPNGHEFEQTQRDSKGQRRLVCCIPMGCKESDITEQLNSNYIEQYRYKNISRCKGSSNGVALF